MPKIFKPGKIVVVLQGRYAGRKAVVVNSVDKATKERPYAHLLIAGVDRYPKRIKSSMPRLKIARRSRIKPFIKVINQAHVLPTRYTMDITLNKVDLRGVINNSNLSTGRVAVRRNLKSQFENRYRAGITPWFFQKLRF